MIPGVLRGKFTLSEDQLTSTVFDLLDLLPQRVLLDWLRCARAWPGGGPSIQFGPEARAVVHYWPTTTRHGEPDLLVLVEDGADAHAIVVEAKYGAGKSQWDASCDEAHEGGTKRDQLVRYWRALQEADFPRLPIDALARALPTVVYLTPDAAPPNDDLDQSHCLDRTMRLAWLSWRDLQIPLSRHTDFDRLGTEIVGRLRHLLAHLGLTAFRGFDLAAVRTSVDGRKRWLFWPGGYSPGPMVNEGSSWRF